MLNKPFGYSYLIDLYNCRPGACDDLELHYRFLEELVERLDMVPMTMPILCHAPVEWEKIGPIPGPKAVCPTGYDVFRIEKYPDKAGVSGWIGLITSGIQIHSCEPKRFSTIDVYSCNEFQVDGVREFCKQIFGFEHFEDHFVERGKKYHV